MTALQRAAGLTLLSISAVVSCAALEHGCALSSASDETSESERGAQSARSPSLDASMDAANSSELREDSATDSAMVPGSEAPWQRAGSADVTAQTSASPRDGGAPDLAATDARVIADAGVKRPQAMESRACGGRVGYVSASGNCYFTLAEPATWFTSRDDCARSGCHLVTITSEAEQQFVASIVDDVAHWIGLSRFGAVRFSWVNGESYAYSAWAPGAPSQRSEAGALLQLNGGAWSDATPSDIHPCICECP